MLGYLLQLLLVLTTFNVALQYVKTSAKDNECVSKLFHHLHRLKLCGRWLAYKKNLLEASYWLYTKEAITFEDLSELKQQLNFPNPEFCDSFKNSIRLHHQGNTQKNWPNWVFELIPKRFQYVDYFLYFTGNSNHRDLSCKF